MAALSNIHPILVHFPIALLTLYAALELVPTRWFNIDLFTTKSILIILGGLSLLAARQAGDLARHLVADPSLAPLIHKHESYANISTAIFGIIAAGYVFAIIKVWIRKNNFNQFTQLLQPVFYLQSLLTETFLVKVLAIAGFAALLITGALGGSIVYGHDSDFFTNFIYHLFF